MSLLYLNTKKFVNLLAYQQTLQNVQIPIQV